MTAPDGSIYAAALGGTVQQRTNAAGCGNQSGAQTGPVTAPTTTITVTDEAAAAQVGPDLKPKSPEAVESQAQQPAATVPGQTVYSAQPAAPMLQASTNRLCFVFIPTTR